MTLAYKVAPPLHPSHGGEFKGEIASFGVYKPINQRRLKAETENIAFNGKYINSLQIGVAD
jgi:hypothetical protein